jgi:hypothetical protein
LKMSRFRRRGRRWPWGPRSAPSPSCRRRRSRG